MSESVQWTLLLPALLLCLLGVVQAGVWLNARTFAQQAAAAGADAAALAGGDATSAAAVARRVAESGDVREIRITFSRQDDTVRCIVWGRAPLLFDIGQGAVEGRAAAVTEGA